jgi:putative phosphoserine phosphatase/1-acylglycerol-3-phosphate O-acyltransferase
MTARRSALADIRSMPKGPKVAAFVDFDGTLIPGYSITAFLRERVRRGELGLLDVGRTGLSLFDAFTGRVGNRELIERGMAEWRGAVLEELEAVGRKLFETEFSQQLVPEMREIVETHRECGHTIAIATSAASFQVEPVARSLDIEHVLCTRMETQKGLLTGKARGPILWGPHKASAARQFAESRGIDLGKSFFYADGDEDQALMHLVGNPRPVNPRERLGRIAGRRGWPVLRFASRARPKPDAVLRSVTATASAIPVFLGAAAMRALTGDTREVANFTTSALTDIALSLGKIRLNVQGQENLWVRRPAVFIWNHRNIFDAQIVGNLVRRDFGAVAKKELSRDPFFATAARFMHIAFVDRENTKAAIATLEPATKMLAEGISMVIAPEGTRTAGGEIGPFKKGAFRMAMAAKVPIVPIVIRNADDVGTRNSSVARPGTVDVVVLPPVDVSRWRRSNLDARIEEVRQAFVRTLANGPEGTR